MKIAGGEKKKMNKSTFPTQTQRKCKNNNGQLFIKKCDCVNDFKSVMQN